MLPILCKDEPHEVNSRNRIALVEKAQDLFNSCFANDCSVARRAFKIVYEYVKTGLLHPSFYRFALRFNTDLRPVLDRCSRQQNVVESGISQLHGHSRASVREPLCSSASFILSAQESQKRTKEEAINNSSQINEAETRH